MRIRDLTLSGVKLVRPQIFHDERGFFLESYRKPKYREMGIEGDFIQTNLSCSKKNVLRGMHFQQFPGQAKLISVIEGTIFDVVVDIRPDSPTFMKWEGIALDSILHEQLFVPVGFAHGFCALSESAHVLYKVTSLYDPALERGFRYDDPEVGIQWPVSSPLVSERDQNAPPLREAIS